MSVSVKQPPELKKKHFSKKQLHNPSALLGVEGEACACLFLTQQKYRYLDQNIRLGNIEVDLVFLDPQTKEVVFVEVKTRRSTRFGSPSLAVTHHKYHRMHRVANQFLASHQLENDFRFDIISIIASGPVDQWRIEHFKNTTLLG